MASAPVPKKVVLVTGANSGLGLHACLYVAKQDNYHLILTGRDQQRVHDAAVKVRTVAATSTTVEEGVLDLASLNAVQAYAEKLLKRDDIPEISAIICNGGVQLYTKTTTVDGLEATFAINHLSHFLLANLLRDRTKRIIMISSEAHDPDEHTGAPVPDVSDLDQLARGREPYNPGEAYSSSKLCNLLFMAEWLRRFPDGAECISYTPGFTPDTALLRDSGMDVSMLVNLCKANNVPVSTSAFSGSFMGRLAVEDWAEYGWKSGQYIRLDKPHPPSVQARDAKLAEALWSKSEELVQRRLPTHA